VPDEEFRWFTSSFSGGNGDRCVELAFLSGGVAVRDTKDRTLPPPLPRHILVRVPDRRACRRVRPGLTNEPITPAVLG
jgi:hypothetical protein